MKVTTIMYLHESLNLLKHLEPKIQFFGLIHKNF